jgi:hypothetical protein
VEQMQEAVKILAAGEDFVDRRLQRAWDERVQHVWEKRCLPEDLAAAFRSLWERYTAPGDDPRRTKMRTMDAAEQAAAAVEIVGFAMDVTVMHALSTASDR